MADDQTQPAAMAQAPLRATAIIGTAFGLYRRHWRTLLPIVVLAAPVAVSIPTTRAIAGPGSQYQVVVHHRVVATGTSWTDTAVVVLALLAGVLVLAVVAGAVTRAAVAAVAGEDLGVRRSYRFAVGRVWPLFLVLALTWLLTMVGFVLFVVPGVIVGVLLAVSVPALVVEGTRVRGALVRSWSLVAGRWWHSFGVLLLTWLLLGLAVGLLGTAADALGFGWLAETVVQALSINLVTPFAALVVVLLYLDAGPPPSDRRAPEA
jgi:hypothetical protein